MDTELWLFQALTLSTSVHSHRVSAPSPRVGSNSYKLFNKYHITEFKAAPNTCNVNIQDAMPEVSKFTQ